MKPRLYTLLRLLIVSMISACPLSGRCGGLPVPPPADGDSVTVSLLTAYPGNIIYELEGHTMLRIRYAGYDMCVNWGVFDFNESDFVYRFVKGETDYMAACYPTYLALDEYASRGRRVSERIFHLDSVQARLAVALVDDNLSPENLRYRYNYLFDNCATRPFDLVTRAMGDTLVLAGRDGIPNLTFRQLMRHYHRNYPWYQFGIDLALGSGVDRPMTVRESMFAPLNLQSLLDSARTTGGAEVAGPVSVVVPGPEGGTVSAPTPWWLSPDAVCWTVTVISLVSLAISMIRRRQPKILTTLVFSVNFIAGLLLTFLIFISTHEATSPNWLYLWLNPLCLFPAIAIWLKKCNKALIFYHFANFALLFCLGIAAVSGLQSLNSGFVPLILLDASISAAYLVSVKWSKRKHI